MSTWLEPKPNHFESPLPDLDPIVADRLSRLGLVSEQQILAFLDPTHYNPTPATELTGLTAVADRVESAIRNRESICVWGDFDVDGQTSTTILVSTLQELGARVTYHIPVRIPESHGLNIPYLVKIIENGTKLVLTCDTGISAHESIEYANTRGVDVVITDHHDLPPELPRAVAITNPKFLPVDHPLATLAGAGVAYKLAEELFSRFGLLNSAEKHLDLAALGLVADLAVLQGDTRYLVQRGLEALRNTHRLGLKILMDTAELNPEHLTEEHIGFVIAPRLNALGRLADANDAVEFFTTSDSSRARVIVTILEGLNAQRQLLTSQVYAATESQIQKDPSILLKPLIVLAHPDWPSGIIGIVASRLVDRYHRPVILLSNPPDEPARGSARSIEGINLTAAIANHKDLLLSFGGHPMAAGLSMDSDKIAEFQRVLGKTIASLKPEMDIEHVIQIDKVYALDELNLDLADTIEQLAPFGPGNPKPVLASNDLIIINSSKIGHHQDHIKFLVEDSTGSQQTVLWWNAGGEELPEGRFDLAYNLRASDWKGLRQIQMEFIDFRVSVDEQVQKKASDIEIVDYRDNDDSLSLIKNFPGGTLVWMEGEEKSSLTHRLNKVNPTIKIADRNELIPSACFAIWTPPASLKEFKNALEIVKPGQIILLKMSPLTVAPETFIGQLMGLVKYSLNHHKGITTYSALAAATSQRERTIHSALSWMIFQGQVSISQEAGDEIKLQKGTSLKDPIQAGRIWDEVRSLLEETLAYRTHFISADKKMLLP
ncbi:MAG: single-stranded-DNA-specific exonuclease RecJ [Chloroflexi bacterium GWB2_49_20]|nr:MAG: single-stranded-DNA-specific exonuclease RecJ [Chloroflexi bacterium GWB2_49_20]OGN78489.1 MAG: single-stranded-DNA-specific exonuclease RecJ [Chloroflexi bacterium GWC2_49_37]OGN84048.1 MAG: single-stranded-DNA-specific exonuclease RecJ [Chloroflexi bacterium GWD2_49_16]HBG75308.1 single-stranded-DNA-specific exonuclease RecJ [Anaerolineae bacterium]HCC79058.1 single-stranded-DNA-specific exonuclease RecJ [Anaerolineae bacterium]